MLRIVPSLALPFGDYVVTQIVEPKTLQRTLHFAEVGLTLVVYALSA